MAVRLVAIKVMTMAHELMWDVFMASMIESLE